MPPSPALLLRCSALFAAPLALALASTGCATWAPRPAHEAVPTPALALPAQWSGAAATATPSAASSASSATIAATATADDWWQGFGDPVLSTLVDTALAHNLELHSARTNVARARALRRLAESAQQTQLGLGASVGRSRSGGGSSGGGGSGSNSLRLGLDASWEADLAGANAAATAAASADLAVAASTLQATRLQIAAETALAYLQWQGARAQHASGARSLHSQQQTLALVELRARAGLASGLELEQARSAVLQLQARQASLQDAQAQTVHALAVLLGATPDSTQAVLAPRLAQAALATTAAPPLPALPQPAALLQRRWDLQAASQRIAAQLATLTQRQAERRPDLRISGNLALQAATWSALGGPGALLAGLAAAIDWPLADGGAGAARVDAQEAALDAARIAWQAAVLTALRDVEDALSAVATAGTRVATLQQAQTAADEAQRLARIGYESGLSDFLTLLDAERSALGAADALSSARIDLAASHVRLYKALGGRWNPDPDARSTRP